MVDAPLEEISVNPDEYTLSFRVDYVYPCAEPCYDVTCLILSG